MKYCSQSDGADRDPNGFEAETDEKRRKPKSSGNTAQYGIIPAHPLPTPRIPPSLFQSIIRFAQILRHTLILALTDALKLTHTQKYAHLQTQEHTHNTHTHTLNTHRDGASSAGCRLQHSVQKMRRHRTHRL
jgi:hypothetical protein